MVLLWAVVLGGNFFSPYKLSPIFNSSFCQLLQQDGWMIMLQFLRRGVKGLFSACRLMANGLHWAV